MIKYTINLFLVIALLVSVPASAQTFRERVTNAVNSAGQKKDTALKQLRGEMRLIRAGTNAAIKKAKGHTLTEKESQDFAQLAKHAGIALGLVAVVAIGTGMGIAKYKQRQQRQQQEAAWENLRVSDLPEDIVQQPPAAPAPIKLTTFDPRKIKKRETPLETKEEYASRKAAALREYEEWAPPLPYRDPEQLYASLLNASTSLAVQNQPVLNMQQQEDAKLIGALSAMKQDQAYSQDANLIDSLIAISQPVNTSLGQSMIASGGPAAVAPLTGSQKERAIQLLADALATLRGQQQSSVGGAIPVIDLGKKAQKGAMKKKQSGSNKKQVSFEKKK